MPPRRSHRSLSRFRPRGPVHHAGRLVVADLADALAVIARVVADPARTETIAVLLDRSRRPGAYLVVDGCGSVGAVGELADLVLATAGDPAAGVAAAVLATVRPDAAAPDPGDHWWCFYLCDGFDDAGVDLLDWLILGRGGPVSMAELTDSRSRW